MVKAEDVNDLDRLMTEVGSIDRLLRDMAAFD